MPVHDVTRKHSGVDCSRFTEHLNPSYISLMILFHVPFDAWYSMSLHYFPELDPMNSAIVRTPKTPLRMLLSIKF